MYIGIRYNIGNFFGNVKCVSDEVIHPILSTFESLQRKKKKKVPPPSPSHPFTLGFTCVTSTGWDNPGQNRRGIWGKKKNTTKFGYSSVAYSFLDVKICLLVTWYYKQA